MGDVVLDAISSLQVVVDAGAVKSDALTQQRDSLITQIRQLQGQVAELNNQIATMEGSDVSLARTALKVLKAIGPNGEVPRGIGRYL